MTYLEDTVSLLASEPLEPDEKLFVSLALSPVSPDRSLKWTSEAFDEFRSPIALMLRSGALAFASGNTGSLQQALESVSDAQAALRFLPRSPHAIHTCLYAHVSALVLGQQSEGETFVREHTEACERFAEQLKEYPRHGLGNLLAAGFYRDFGDAAKARERFESIRDVGTGPYFKSVYADFLYGQHDIEEALRVLSEMESDASSNVTYAMLRAEQTGKWDEARVVLEQGLEEPAHPYFHVRWLAALCALGYADESKRQAIRLLRELAEDHGIVLRGQMHFFAGRSDAQRLLEVAGDSRVERCTAHWLIAQAELGKRNRDTAREHLKQCVAYFGYADYEAAKSMLRRMEDPKWPYWMADVHHHTIDRP